MTLFQPRERFGGLIGRSAAMRAVFDVLERAAASDATVLLDGEAGTGKEVAAEAIHRESRRRDRPFVVIDCGASPPALLESELFGHARDSFTETPGEGGGAFLQARGGTVFLDEIGELALDLQPTLLRAIEAREIKPVGSSRWLPVDVRVVAATSRDLHEEVNAEHFSADLHRRLAVIPVSLPPLRDRIEDLPLLVEHLVGEMGATRSEASALLGPAFLEELACHRWLGNVRELRNYLQRCLPMAGRRTWH